MCQFTQNFDHCGCYRGQGMEFSKAVDSKAVNPVVCTKPKFKPHKVPNGHDKCPDCEDLQVMKEQEVAASKTISDAGKDKTATAKQLKDLNDMFKSHGERVRDLGSNASSHVPALKELRQKLENEQKRFVADIDRHEAHMVALDKKIPEAKAVLARLKSEIGITQRKTTEWKARWQGVAAAAIQNDYEVVTTTRTDNLWGFQSPGEQEAYRQTELRKNPMAARRIYLHWTGEENVGGLGFGIPEYRWRQGQQDILDYRRRTKT